MRLSIELGRASGRERRRVGMGVLTVAEEIILASVFLATEFPVDKDTTDEVLLLSVLRLVPREIL